MEVYLNLQSYTFRANMLSFLDALASLGSVLESHSVSQSVGNVFEILSNLGHIFRLSSRYVQGMFRVASE